MKIVSCFTKIEEIDPLANVNIDELYFGLDEIPSFGYGNLKTLNEAEMAINKTHAYGLKINLAMNRPRISKADVDSLKNIIVILDQMGIDGIIVANLTLLLELNRLREKGSITTAIHLSSVQPCFNYHTVKFFKRFGISRVILPNQLTPAEAGKIIDQGSIETEVFDPRFFACPFINGRCKLHREISIPENHPSVFQEKKHPCNLDFNSDFNLDIKPVMKKKFPQSIIDDMTSLIKKNCYNGWGERLISYLAIFEYYIKGVDFIKFGTRPDPTALKLEKVMIMRKTLDFLETVTKEYDHDTARKKFIEYCK